MSCKYPKFRKSAGCVVACGNCTPCMLKKQRQKASRVLLEGRANPSAPVLFVSLTYDDAHLPTRCIRRETDPEDKTQKITRFYECPTGTLDPSHVVNFLKRLRYHAAKKDFKIRAVYAGEYGDEKKRPHYHLIIWGLPYSERKMIYDSWIDKRKFPMCDPRYLDIQIPKNERHVANYISKYLLSDKKRKDSSSLNGAYKEFYVTSKGLGLEYALGTANALMKPSGLQNLWLTGAVPSSFFFDGKNYPLDRYMKEKIYALLPSVFAEELPKAALDNYKKEMYDLYETALLDEAFAEKALNMPFEEALELAVRLSNAKRATEIEQKNAFFTSKRRNLDV